MSRGITSFFGKGYRCPLELIDLTGLQIYYNFNDNVNDQSGNGNNGTPTALTYQSSSNGLNNNPFRKSGVFNGSSTQVICPQKDYNISTGFTVSIWVKTITTTERQIFTSDGNFLGGGVRAWQFRTENNGSLRFIRFISGNAIQISTAQQLINDNKWHHVAARFSTTSGMNIYVDGVSRANEGTTTNNLSGATMQPFISIGQFLGDLEEAVLFNRALTLDEIKILAGGCPLKNN